MLVSVVSQNFFQVNGIGLERADQTKIKIAGMGKEILQFSGRVDLRQPVLAALLGCFNRDLLPLCLLLFRFLRIKIDNRALGNERRNFRSADLDRLLHNQIHVFSFWNCLSESDAAAEWRSFGFL